MANSGVARLTIGIESKEMVEALAKFGTEPTFQPPAEFGATVKSEIARWGPVVKASGFVALD